MHIPKRSKEGTEQQQARTNLEALRRLFPNVPQRTFADHVHANCTYAFARLAFPDGDYLTRHGDFGKLQALVFGADEDRAGFATAYGRVRAIDAKIKGHDNRGVNFTQRQTQVA
jgi:hypothetical protein